MKKIKSALKVIATAINRDTEALIDFLKIQGIKVDNNPSKAELQLIVTKALANSKSFAENFKNWVKDRYNQQYKNVIGDGIGYSFGQSGALNLSNSSTSSIFGTNTPSIVSTQGVNSTTTTTTNAQNGFWKDVDFNTILDFTKDSLNNFVTLQQSKTEQAIVDAALQKELLQQQQSGSLSPTSGNNTTTIVVVSLLVVALVGAGIYFYSKKK